MGRLKKITEHPVISAVIAGILLMGISAWAGLLVPTWLAIVSAFFWLSGTSQVWNWLLVALILIASIVVIIGLRRLWIVVATIRHNATTSGAKEIDGVLWRFELIDGEVWHLFPCCPKCDVEIDPTTEIVRGGKPATRYRCPTCRTIDGVRDGHPDAARKAVKRIVERDLRQSAGRVFL